MSADADRLKEIEARANETTEAWTDLGPYRSPVATGWYVEDVPYLLALVQGMREREERLTEALAVAEKRLRHNEFHRSHNRRSMRQRGKTIVKLCAKIERQREAIRDLLGHPESKGRLVMERASELQRSLRTGEPDDAVLASGPDTDSST